MKKKLAATLSVVLILGLAVLGILAYLTDTDSDVNVMTLGEVKIEQIEQERDANGNLVDFTQNKAALPAVGPIVWAEKGATVNGNEYKVFSEDLKNVVDKIVTVKNTGKSDAYVRTIVAIEAPNYDPEDLIHINHNGKGVTTSTPITAEIDGIEFVVFEFTYDAALAPEEISVPSLMQVFLDSETTNEDCAAFGDNWEIRVLSQAAQTEGFADAQTALDTAFGDVTEAKIIEWFTGMKPEVEVDGNKAADLTKAIAAAPEGGVVTLTEDMNFGTITFTVDKNVEIDLNGKTVSSETRNGTFYLKNGASIKNGTVEHKGTVAGIKVWQSEGIENVDVILSGKSGSGNVITGISVQEGTDTYIKYMKNVTVKSTGENKTYNGIETYNCGARTDLAIGDMENVKVDVNGTAFLLSAPAGTATKCEFKGDVCGINAHLKGVYNVSLKLVDSTVEGPTGIYAWDEPSKTNPGSLKLEGVNTTVTGEVKIAPAEDFGDRWSVIGFN